MFDCVALEQPFLIDPVVAAIQAGTKKRKRASAKTSEFGQAMIALAPAKTSKKRP